MTPGQPSSVMARELLPASIAIYTTVALVAFEGLAVAAALPEVAADLGGIHLLPWVITGYLLTAGIATVIAGPLVDAFGARVMFRWAVGVFTVAGVACGFAPSMTVLVGGRLLQGAGGGLVIAVGLAAVSLVYPQHLVGRAFAANSTVWGVMGVAGPAIAGALLTTLDWTWIFFVNLPLGGMALAAGWRALPEALEDAEELRLDLVGAFLLSVFTASSLLAVDRLGTASIPWAGMAVVTGLVYVRHASRHDRPVLRLHHIARHPYAGLAAGIGLLLAGAIGIHAYLPLYVQGGRGVGAAMTAWSVAFFTVGWTTGSNIAGRLTDRLAETTVLLGGYLAGLIGLGLVWAGAGLHLGLAAILSAFTIAGIGVGAATNAGLTLLRAVTPPAQIGRAAAAHQFARNQGFTFGSAIGGAVLLLVVSQQVGSMDPVQRLLAGETGAAMIGASLAIRAGFATAAGVCFGLAATGFLPILSLRRHLAEARAGRRAAR